MRLVPFWFIVITILWTGFFILEGFDFGVGMLHGIVGKDEAGRRAAINTIGPLWDGNEVWLVVAAAAMFAAFPGWYATMFSALYLALVLLLVALIVRGVSFEYRGKRDAVRWRRSWDVLLTAGSVAAPLLLGIALGDLLHGLPINSSQNYTGSFWDLLQPYALFTGITLVLICALHGATFMSLKTIGDSRERSGQLARRIAPFTAAAVVGFVIWTHVTASSAFFLNPVELLAVLAVIAAVWLVRDHREGFAFAATTITMAACIISIFTGLYPNVMVSSTNAAYNLTVHNTASGEYSLKVMSVVVVIFLPFVLAYQTWTYYVFRRRISQADFEPQHVPGPSAATHEARRAASRPGKLTGRPGPVPVAVAGSEDRDRVDRGSGGPGQPQRRDHAAERPAAGFLAERDGVVKLQVIHQLQAHRVDREHVHGEVDAVGGAGRRVAIAVAAQHRDPPLGHEFQCRRMQPRARVSGVPRAELVPALAVPHPDEQQVACADAHVLRLLGRDQVIGRHVLAGLEPGHPAQPRNVEQDTAAGDPVPGHLNGQLRGAVRGDGGGGHAVVQRRVVDDMTQGVEVTVRVAVHVHGQPVHGEGQSGRIGLAAGGTDHLMDARFRVVGRLNILDGSGQRDRAAEPGLAQPGKHPLRRQVIQRATPVSRPPGCSAPQPLVESAEVGPVQDWCAPLALWSGHRVILPAGWQAASPVRCDGSRPD